MTFPPIARRGFYAAFFSVLCALILHRFGPYFPSVFYGDDLAMYFYTHGQESNDAQLSALLSFIGTKFRPVFTVMLSFETHLFTKHLGRYLAVNVIINAATGLAAFAVFMRLSKSWIVSSLFAVALVTSRFAMYQVTQVTGQVESIPFLLFVLTVFFAHKAVVELDEQAIRRYEWIALALAALAFNAHERYLVVLPWLVVTFFATRNNVGKRHRIAFLCIAAAVIATNALIKHFALHAAFFEGTGGQKLAISVPSIVDLALQAVLSVFGINTGPEFLAGTPWIMIDRTVRTVCSVFAIGAAALAGRAITMTGRSGRALVSFPCLLGLAAVFLIVPPAMTIRMEQRWELAPFFILLALMSFWVGSHDTPRKMRGAVAIGALLALCNLTFEAYMADGLRSVFLIDAEDYAAAIRQDIVNAGIAPKGKEIVLVADPGTCQWALLYGRGFFDFYGAPRQAVCARSPEEARKIAAGRPIFSFDKEQHRLLNVH